MLFGHCLWSGQNEIASQNLCIRKGQLAYCAETKIKPALVHKPVTDTLSLFVTGACNRVPALYGPSENASLYHTVK
jgi:hypothetical protein